MRATIVSVTSEHRIWEGGQNGPMAFVEGMFNDGTGWSVGCKPENADKRKEEFRALIGKEGEFETKGSSEYKGITRYKLANWPGKSGPGGGGFSGGKAPYQVAFANSREGMIFTTASIQAQVALKSAVEFLHGRSPATEADVLKYADAFIGWLTAHTPPPAEAPKPPETPAAAPAASAGPTPREKAQVLVKAKIEAFEGCMTAQGFELLAENVKTIRTRLIETGMNDLLAELDAASDRCESRFSDGEPPF